ncbi:MAG: DUF4097 domain-containing protein [Bacteroidetes bacterium]|nr:DUF4097 domain-containing protein [Rhodothermia bacterium]MCX7907603.1 DUF4097 domain-containing protein [Bacteroidota bacterium]MDW8286434.1 DUF4097 family beta strand repeat-containing protein [Bacteroidota bacterium]
MQLMRPNWVLIALGIALVAAGLWNVTRRRSPAQPHQAAAHPVVAEATERQPEQELLWSQVFSLSPGGRFSLRTEGGSVRLEGGEGDSLVVRVLVRGVRAERARAWWRRHHLEVRAYPNEVAIAHESPRREALWEAFRDYELEFHVRAPRALQAHLTSAGGDIFASAFAGRLEARTAGGEIELVGVGGALAVQSSGGNIRLRDFAASEAQISASGGDIRLDSGRAEDLRVRTSGGDIRLKAVRVGRSLALTASGGDIEAWLAELGSEVNSLRAAGGDVVLYLPRSIPLRMRLRGDRVRVDSALAAAHVVWEGGRSGIHLEQSPKAEGRPLEVRASGGAILLRALR